MIAVTFATIIGAITIFYNVRLKSRAENRQAWINLIRTEIGVLISAFPQPQASERQIDAAYLEVRQRFTMLELYLNPRERVHRAFIEVLRFMYGIVPANTDEEACNKLCIPRVQRPWRDHNIADPAMEWLKWKSKAIRLANVLLKREWEQVKHIN